jgi:hypothetical protein
MEGPSEETTGRRTSNAGPRDEQKAGQITSPLRGPIATDQQMTGALPAGDKRGGKTVFY